MTERTTTDNPDHPAEPPAPRSSRAAALVTTAAFLALVFVPGAYHLAYGLRAADVDRWTAWLRSEPTAAEAVRKIETDLDQRFLLSRVTRTLVSGVPVTALRPRGETVRRGTDGFLFYGVDAQVPMAAGFLDPRFDRGSDAAAAIADTAAQLRARGVHLLVVPLPAKSSINPERLNPNYDLSRGPDLNVDHRVWIERLRADGVDVLDLADQFWAWRATTPLFWPTETHWSHEATRLTAREIAARVRPHLAGAPPAPPYETRRVSLVRAGDLGILDSVDDADGTTSSGRDIREELLQLHDANGHPVMPGDEAPVLLLGDSFAEQYVQSGAGLSQLLMNELGVAVQSAAMVGGKGDTMRRPLRDQPAVLENKRVVVFAFTIRLLVCCDWNKMAVAKPAARQQLTTNNWPLTTDH